MLSKTFWIELVPLFVFLGFIALELALNRVLPASVGPYLPKRWLFILISAVILLTVLGMFLYIMAIA